MSEDRGVMFRQAQTEMFTQIIPANVNAFNMASGASNPGQQQAMTPQEPQVNVTELAATQEAVMNSINAPAQNFASSTPIMRQMAESDIAVVSTSAMKMGGELLGRAFDLFGAGDEPSQDPMRDMEQKFQPAMRPAPTMSFGMGVGAGGI